MRTFKWEFTIFSGEMALTWRARKRHLPITCIYFYINKLFHLHTFARRYQCEQRSIGRSVGRSFTRNNHLAYRNINIAHFKCNSKMLLLWLQYHTQNTFLLFSNIGQHQICIYVHLWSIRCHCHSTCFRSHIQLSYLFYTLVYFIHIIITIKQCKRKIRDGKKTEKKREREIVCTMASWEENEGRKT